MDIRFGAMAPSLVEQLADTGISPNVLAKFDQHDKAITRLYIHGILAEGEKNNARKRLVKEIEQAAKEPEQ